MDDRINTQPTKPAPDVTYVGNHSMISIMEATKGGGSWSVLYVYTDRERKIEGRSFSEVKYFKTHDKAISHKQNIIDTWKTFEPGIKITVKKNHKRR